MVSNDLVTVINKLKKEYELAFKASCEIGFQ
jgi:hypothetical protein